MSRVDIDEFRVRIMIREFEVAVWKGTLKRGVPDRTVGPRNGTEGGKGE